MYHNNIKDALTVCFNAKVVPLLIGHTGVGKSAAVAAAAKHFGGGFIDIRLATMEEGDLVGLPVTLQNSDKMKYSKPEWWPAEGTSGILFLDEINRAQRSTLQAVFQLVHDRRIGNHVLPEGWNLVAAMNPNTEDYFTTEFDDAFASRFCMLRFSNNIKEWLQFSNETEVHSNVINFIKKNPDRLFQHRASFKIDQKATFKQWTKVGELYKAGLADLDLELQYELVQGLVGIENSALYFQSLALDVHPLSASDILDRFNANKETVITYSDVKNYRRDMINITNDNLLGFLSNEENCTQSRLDNLTQYLMIIPKDVAWGFCSNLLGNPALVEYLTKVLPKIEAR